jgi:ribA/ribD-fused uncharacterized protein
LRVTDKYTFFYGHHPFMNPAWVFSNWAETPFIDREGNLFRTNEHFMMYRKALLFGDLETAEKILTAETPREAKLLGRKVTPFDKNVWNSEAKSVVYEGAKLKFLAHPEACKELLATKGTLLVEASPYDVVWGVGLAEYNTAINDPANWRGSNWLGEVLTELRDHFLAISF